MMEMPGDLILEYYNRIYEYEYVDFLEEIQFQVFRKK